MQLDLKKKKKKIKLPSIKGKNKSPKAKTTKMKLPKNSDKKSKRKKVIRIILLLIIVSALGFGGFWGYKTYKTIRETGINPNPTKSIINKITQKDPELVKDEENRTNALLVGIDTRSTREGLRNTDTIIVLSLDHDTKEILMISIPRDMWAENPQSPGYYTKINAIYNFCEASEKGSGDRCLATVAKKITGLDIHYFGMVNIDSFVEIIDIIGGVDVDVENAFTDYQFPDRNNQYITVSFKEGEQHMDGETAMQYARSRHAQSVEGSDFARARRQQKVIMAAKEKALSSETLTSPKKIFEIMTELGKGITLTNISEKNDQEITLEDIEAALIVGDKVKDDSIYSTVLDPMAGNWTLIMEDPSAAYILLPKAGAGNWTEVKKYVTTLLEFPALYSEAAKIYIYNGGLGYNETAAKVNKLQSDYPYLLIKFGGNTYPQTYKDITIADFSKGKKQATLDELAEYYEVETDFKKPEGLTNPYAENIVIIFGAPTPEPAENAE